MGVIPTPQGSNYYKREEFGLARVFHVHPRGRFAACSGLASFNGVRMALICANNLDMIVLTQVKKVSLSFLYVLCSMPWFQGSLFLTEGRSELCPHIGTGTPWGRGGVAALALFVPEKKLEREGQ
jgi:hypothetical protein